jgi:hypothetical protein
MAIPRTLKLTVNGRNRTTHLTPLALAAPVLVSSTIVSEAQSSASTSRLGDSRSTTGVGVIAAPQARTTLSSIKVSWNDTRSSAPPPSTRPSSPVIGRPEISSIKAIPCSIKADFSNDASRSLTTSTYDEHDVHLGWQQRNTVARRWPRHHGSVHGLLGTRDAHDQGGMESSVSALVQPPRGG